MSKSKSRKKRRKKEIATQHIVGSGMGELILTHPEYLQWQEWAEREFNWHPDDPNYDRRKGAIKDRNLLPNEQPPWAKREPAIAKLIKSERLLVKANRVLDLCCVINNQSNWLSLHPVEFQKNRFELLLVAYWYELEKFTQGLEGSFDVLLVRVPAEQDPEVKEWLALNQAASAGAKILFLVEKRKKVIDFASLPGMSVLAKGEVGDAISYFLFKKSE